MKITLTGSLGNISKPLASRLIAAGHQVSIVSSRVENEGVIRALGAAPLIGSVQDADFVTKAFKGADAVYTMVPPNFNADDLRAFQAGVGRTYAKAIAAAGVSKVVNLSSIGAHLSEGTGPITGMYDTEQSLNGLEKVAIRHLRPAFFYVNFYGNADMIRHAGILGSNYSGDAALLMVHPRDIAEAAAEELLSSFTGKSVRYVASDERKPNEVASVLGAAIGKPGLPWVEFTDEQALNGMLQAGLPKEISRKYVEMGTAVRSGVLWEDYRKHAGALGKIKLEDFAKEFAGIF